MRLREAVITMSCGVGCKVSSSRRRARGGQGLLSAWIGKCWLEAGFSFLHPTGAARSITRCHAVAIPGAIAGPSPQLDAREMRRAATYPRATLAQPHRWACIRAVQAPMVCWILLAMCGSGVWTGQIKSDATESVAGVRSATRTNRRDVQRQIGLFLAWAGPTSAFAWLSARLSTRVVKRGCEW